MREIISIIRNFPRHLITAFQSLIRNSVMSFSSIFAVMITLTMIGIVGLVAYNVQDISHTIEDGISIYVKLDRTIDDATAEALGAQITAIPNVAGIEYSSKDQELDNLIEAQGDAGAALFESYRNDNPLGAAYTVTVINSYSIGQTADEISALEHVNTVDYGGDSTTDLIKTLNTVRNGGTIFVAALGVIALFMIANTIKITIDTRQTEISIMRMVGASNWYIRIPFMFEGMLIGLIGTIIPCAILYYGYDYIYNITNGMVVTQMLSLIPPGEIVIQLMQALAGLGAGVGLVGAFISIRRYLKF